MRLLTEFQSDLYAYISSMMPKVEGKKDVLQETNIILWNKRTDFQLGTSFKAWSFKIAYFQCLAHLKKKKRSKLTELEQRVMSKIATEYPFRSPDKERVDALDPCMEKLNPTDRSLITHHYSRNGSLQDYARLTKVSIGKLKHALIRIRYQLKCCIEQSVDS